MEAEADQKAGCLSGDDRDDDDDDHDDNDNDKENDYKDYTRQHTIIQWHHGDTVSIQRKSSQN